MKNTKQAKIRILKGDTVRIMVGKDRGKEGKVAQVLPKEGTIVVEGFNKRVKHIKKQGNQAGQRIEFSAPMNASNVQILDPKTSKPTRIGIKTTESGKRVRIAKKSGSPIQVEVSKK